ncbi:MAG: IS3 family transposase, partial [Sulfuriferula multivorans]|nr:IS3 family transposase [Sulfuriferula multivorans]
MIKRVWRGHKQGYGVNKVWKQLQREHITVAHCPVHRLMRHLGPAWGPRPGQICAQRTATPLRPVRWTGLVGSSRLIGPTSGGFLTSP